MKPYLLSAALLLFSTGLVAQDRYYVDSKGVAIHGYDPVSYLDPGKAEKGSPAFAFTYDGVTYHFVSAEHRERVRQNPEKYKPQFGGWCAYAVGAYSGKAPVNPETFQVVDGKVYLFYNRLGSNTLVSWKKDQDRLLPASHANWPNIQDTPAKK